MKTKTMLHTGLDVPELSDAYPLSDQQIADFRRDGHVCLPGVCSSEEVAAYRPPISEAAQAHFPNMRPMEDRDACGKAFLQTLNLRFKSEAVRKFVLSKRLAGIAARLVGETTMRLYHEQALFKEPGGAHSPLHQDQYYWPLDTLNALGMWMPLVDVSLDMGPILFASGSHVEGFAGQHAISDTSQKIFEQLVEEKKYPIWQQAMQAGDATFHRGWTIHGASANHTDILREATIVTWYPDGTRVDELSNDTRVGDAKAFLGRRQAGELADSDMNPVVYP